LWKGIFSEFENKPSSQQDSQHDQNNPWCILTRTTNMTGESFKMGLKTDFCYSLSSVCGFRKCKTKLSWCCS